MPVLFFFLQANRVHARFSKTGWFVDKTTVFAQIDAFIQRCKDLLEVK
jgi:dynein heavy chain